MKTIYKLLSIFSFIFAIFSSNVSASFIYFASVGDYSVNIGETFNVPLSVKASSTSQVGSGIPANLYETLSWDSSILKLNSFTPNNDASTHFYYINIQQNSIDIQGDCCTGYYSGSVGAFNFTSLKSGTSPLHLSFGTDGQVAVVPIPSALWLMGSGLLGLIGLRRNS